MTSLLISAQAASGGAGGFLVSIMPLVLIFAVVLFSAHPSAAKEDERASRQNRCCTKK